MGPRGYRGLLPSDYYLNPENKERFAIEPGIYHWFYGDREREINPIPVICPLGAVGDVVGVKERWARHYAWYPPIAENLKAVHYRADLPDDPDAAMTANHAFGLMEWQDADTMPDWAIRSWLKVGAVTAKRVLSLTDEEILAATLLTGYSKEELQQKRSKFDQFEHWCKVNASSVSRDRADERFAWQIFFEEWDATHGKTAGLESASDPFLFLANVVKVEKE